MFSVLKPTCLLTIPCTIQWFCCCMLPRILKPVLAAIAKQSLPSVSTATKMFSGGRGREGEIHTSEMKHHGRVGRRGASRCGEAVV